MKATIVSLGDASDAKLYGGKAANLALMLQSGPPVPNGFAKRVLIKSLSERTGKIDYLASGGWAYIMSSLTPIFLLMQLIWQLKNITRDVHS